MNAPRPMPLGGLLEQLRGELEAQANPGRLAFGWLRPDAAGAVAEPYTAEALAAWETMRRRSPGDLCVRHHLAISIHARAFDLETSATPELADGDWRRALELWHGLWAADSFWRDLSADPDTLELLQAVREGLPEKLLAIHFAIALDDGAAPSRGAFHIRLALASSFPSASKESVRSAAYQHLIRDLPNATWDRLTLDPGTLDAGLRPVRRYLSVDAEFLPALRDLLDLLTRLQTGYVQRINAARDGSEEAAAKGLLRQLEELARDHEPAILRLERRLDALPPESLSLLALWHDRAGQASAVLGDDALAIDRFHRALHAARSGGEQPERCEEIRRSWLKATLGWALDQAGEGAAGKAKAQQLLSAIAREELPPLCRLLHAKILLRLGDPEGARRDGERARALVEHDRRTPDAERTQLRQECRELLARVDGARRRAAVSAKLTPAKQALESGDATRALALLDDAARIDPEYGPTFYLRAHCHAERLDFDRASQDAARAAALLAPETGGDDDNAQAALAELRRKIDSLRRQRRPARRFLGLRFGGGTTACL